ncbi:YggS family pyridoxal phosphate-dependent enzyme [Weeksellaceae bacterium KMM 9724]|uniref:YggS family pyridoxal phosphate-dependent enzyme n=1 Tax=Profundicola chukchiensis TaxID=2961959 RepID=UPI002440BC9A|nr:YggS family pyridoxal phosphate-dependent enzyme [Profundicola chukchiensis]MDG4951487.1 YggS family pyridoxal phosphate-dependent enzyme [Profundicola chukchiensis]
MSIEENYLRIKKEIPEDVTLVVVSKTHPVEAIQKIYDLGHRDFGENKVQEMLEKAELLPKDIRWHMIGHVQTNKIRQMADFVHLIHGIDKAKRLKEVQKRAKNSDRVQDVLLQVKIADEDTKFGMTLQEAREVLNAENVAKMQNVNIVGLMGMATFTDDMEQVREEFQALKKLYDELKTEFPQIQHLSMGMTADYQIALEEGSNMLRVGSAIFGARDYN